MPSQRRAVAITVVLLVMSVTFVVGLAIMTLGSSNLTLAASQSNGEKAYYLAEAGLAMAADRIGQSGVVTGTLSGPVGEDCRYRAEVYLGGQDVPGWNGKKVPADNYFVRADGILANGLERRVEALLTKSGGDFQVGALADHIDAANSTVDAYNSAAGAYPSTRLDSARVMGTNKKSHWAIDVSGGATDVNGTVMVGPGGDPSDVIRQYPGNPVVAGVFPTEVPIPTITPPTGLPHLSDLIISADHVDIPAGRYDNVRLTATASADLQSNSVYVFGNLTIGAGAMLRLDGKNVTIYIQNSFNTRNNSIVNTGHDTRDLKILSNSNEDFEVGAGADAYCSIIAPNSHVTLKTFDPPGDKLFYGELYGAVIAKTFSLDHCRFHFDTRLMDINCHAGKGAIQITYRQRL